MVFNGHVAAFLDHEQCDAENQFKIPVRGGESLRTDEHKKTTDSVLMTSRTGSLVAQSKIGSSASFLILPPCCNPGRSDTDAGRACLLGGDGSWYSRTSTAWTASVLV